ncbi:MAG TPA: hypothetical protein VGY54_21230, partial [Polyangiaceae bacterium]|nr:hypothetical protein [Polyangiaceae bacterium]
MSRSFFPFALLLLGLLGAAALLVEACGSDSPSGAVVGPSSGSASGSGSNAGSGGAMTTSGSPGGNDAGTPPLSDGGGGAHPDVGASGRTGTDASPSAAADGGGSVDATMGGGNSDAPSGACVPWGQGLIGSNTAPASYTTRVFGCDGGVPGFCDNGVRQMPPTCDPIVDALIARTPPTCASVNSAQSYLLDRD